MKPMLALKSCFILVLALGFCACSDGGGIIPIGSTNAPAQFTLTNGNGLLANVFWSANGPGVSPALGLGLTLGYTDSEGEDCPDPQDNTDQVAKGTAGADGCTSSSAEFTTHCSPGAEIEINIDDGNGNVSSQTVVCPGGDGNTDEEPTEVVFEDLGDTNQIVLFVGPTTDGAMEGREGADALCAENIPEGVEKDNVIAFLSVGKGDVIVDFPSNESVPTDEEVVSSNGTSLALDFDGLLDGDLAASLTAAGEVTSDDRWWSGSDNAGEGSGFNCNGWTDNGGNFVSFYISTGAFGYTNTDTNWMSVGDDECSSTNHILCLAYNSSEEN